MAKNWDPNWGDPQVAVRMPAQLVARIDAFCALVPKEDGSVHSRSEAIRALVEDAITRW